MKMQVGKCYYGGRNLTEDNYLRSTFPFPISPDTFLGYASEPRTFGVSIKQSF